MKILIVTHEFPPLNTIGSLRPYSWAKYWSRMGHEIKVITTRKKRFDGLLNPNFDFSYLSQVKIEEIEYLPSLKHSCSKQGSNTKINPKENKKNDVLSQLKSYSKKVRNFIGLGSLVSIRDLWIRPAVQMSLEIYKDWKFDCIVSSYGPPAPHIIAGILKKKLNIFWVADYRDLWYPTHYLGAKFPFSWVQKQIETFFVSEADLMTIVSDPLRNQLLERFGDKVITIANGFDLEEIPENPQKTSQENSKIQLAYTGKIRAEKQDLKPFFQAICELKRKRINLVDKLDVLFYGWQLDNLSQMIEDYDLSDIIKLPGSIYREEVLKIQRNVDALLFFDWDDPSVDGILTGKIFEYMYSGTPVLGIGASEKTAAGRLIQEAGIGVCLDKSVEKIAQCLEKLLNGEEIPYFPSQEVLQRYTREGLAKKMLEQIVKHQNKQQ